MQRRHLIELHEQPWYPSRLRKMFQEGLGRSLPLMGAYQNLAEPMSRFLERTGTRSILDLCSGSAEPIVELRKSLREPLEAPDQLKVVFSDLYPNLEEFRKLKETYPGVDYCESPVDALRPPEDVPGVRTLFNALHHFHPDQVQEILRDAAEKAEGIAVVESTGRTWRNMLATVTLLPLLSIFITVFLLRPFRFRNLLWGFLVPIIPLTAVFDGLVSNLRTYTVDELRQLTASIDVPGFQWEVGTVDLPKSKLKATYLFGWRQDTGIDAPLAA